MRDFLSNAAFILANVIRDTADDLAFAWRIRNGAPRTRAPFDSIPAQCVECQQSVYDCVCP